jgi:hypothetical protein
MSATPPLIWNAQFQQALPLNLAHLVSDQKCLGRAEPESPLLISVEPKIEIYL